MRYFVLLAAALFLSACSDRPILPDATAVYEATGGSIARIELLGGGFGSGFFVNSAFGKVVVTNAHVCGNKRTMLRIRPSTYGRPFLARVLRISFRQDLCMLAVPKGDSHTALPLAAFAERAGNPIYAVGHPAAAPLTVMSGIMIGRQTIQIPYPPEFCLHTKTKPTPTMFGLLCVRKMKSLQGTALIIPGNSGGPLVNQHGEVVGVVFATDPLGGNYLPLDSLKRFLLLP